jgi:hypothetical protein
MLMGCRPGPQNGAAVIPQAAQPPNVLPGLRPGEHSHPLKPPLAFC